MPITVRRALYDSRLSLLCVKTSAVLLGGTAPLKIERRSDRTSPVPDLACICLASFLPRAPDKVGCFLTAAASALTRSDAPSLFLRLIRHCPEQAIFHLDCILSSSSFPTTHNSLNTTSTSTIPNHTFTHTFSSLIPQRSRKPFLSPLPTHHPSSPSIARPVHS